MSASRLLSTNMAFLVGPRLPFTIMPALTLSVTDWTMRWGIRQCPRVLGRSRDDCKCSTSLQWDCVNVSQLCGMTLATKNETMGM